MLPTPLASSDIMVFILSPSLSLLLSEVPWDWQHPFPVLQVLEQMSFKPLAYLGFQAVRFSGATRPPASGEGPSPLCYLDDHPIYHAILQVKRHACRKGLLAEPAARLCQMPLAMPGLKIPQPGLLETPQAGPQQQGRQGTDSGVGLTSRKLLGQLLIYVSVSSS